MVEADTYLKGAAALVSAAFAIIVIASGPRRPVHWFLSLFFVLIAGNQAAETIRSFAARPDEALLTYRFAHVFASLDPFALYYFASIYPRRNHLNAPWRVGLVLSASGILAGLSWFTGPPVPGHPWWVIEDAARTAFTGIVYTIVLWTALRGLFNETSRPAFRLLLPALCLAAMPVWNTVFIAVAPLVAQGREPVLGWAIWTFLPALALAVGLLAYANRRAPAEPDVRRIVRRSVLAGLLMATALNLSILQQQLADAGPWLFQTLGVIGRGSASVRWLAFGFLVSMAVLRYEMLGMSLRARRRAARVLVALVFLLAGSVLVDATRVVAGSQSVPVSLFELIFLGLVLAASQGFRRLIDRVATAVYGVPMPGDAAAAMEAYRLAVIQAAERGVTDTADTDLARLRDELGIDRRASEVIERMAQASTWGALGPGQLVAGRYRIQRMLGRGGAGRAFLARDELLLREVVLKELRHEDDAGRARALREARAAGGLQHPHVVTLYDVHQQPDASLLVTEYVRGGSLRDRLAKPTPLRRGEGLQIMLDVLEGLDAVHRHGIVHRDLKPANIFLTPEGRAKIGDFGIAWVLHSTTAQAGSIHAFQGTPEFMAPEQRRGEPATPASDIYAAGLVARACLEPDLTAEFQEVIGRALAEDAARRWPSAAAMRAALESAAASSHETSAGFVRPR